MTSTREHSEPSGRLELTWTNKSQRLLSHEDGSYEWTQAGDYRVAEVRLLHNVSIVGQVAADKARAKDNLLIRGDALHALTSLSAIPEFRNEYLGKVKLVYIDPPFNTGQAFEQYDDALEHSVWLTMIRDRLVQIRDLLASDGSVWVHLDDQEMAYCRVLLDEIFGRDNFLACVIWKRRNDPRNTAQYVSADHDLILVYAKHQPSCRFKQLARTEVMDAAYTNPDDDPRGVWRRSDLAARNYYSKGLYPVGTPSGRVVEGPPSGSYWRVSEDEMKRLDEDGRIYWGTKGDSRPYLKRFLTEVSAGRVPSSVWSPEEVGFVRNGKEEVRALLGKVFATPKPERLLQRVLDITTEPGDIVLDCFAGSGTTAAVAHKMQRRWVTVEASKETASEFTFPRLAHVVAGTDAGGITSAQSWTGGSGFRDLAVAPSMFDVVDGRVVLADWTTGGVLAEAVAAQAGFAFEEDSPFSGRKGRQRLAVIDGIVNEDVLRLLLPWLPEDELLTVYGTAVDPSCKAVLSSLRRGSSVKRIPQSVLDDYRRRGERSDGLDWPTVIALDQVPIGDVASHGAPV